MSTDAVLLERPPIPASADDLPRGRALGLFSPRVLLGDRRSTIAWRAGLVFFGLQLVAMLVFSTIQYRRFELTHDFGAYSQAWTAIAHGNLDPYSTVFGIQFWRNDFELIFWPLALAYRIYPHSIDLLWLQDLAVVLTEVVTFAWARDVVASRIPEGRDRVAVLWFAALLLAADPWVWPTIDFDVHTEPFAALFVVLAAKAMWSGRARWALLWVPLALACDAVAGFYILGIGLAALVSARRTRLPGVLVAIAGVASLWLTSRLGAIGSGGQLGNWYGYLVAHPSSHLGIGGIVQGLLAHPGRAVTMFDSHGGYVAGYLLAGGIIGLISPWGLIPAAAVLIPNALNANVEFIHFPEAFQSWTAIPFLIIGTTMVSTRLLLSPRPADDARRSSPKPVFVIGVAVALAAVVMSADYLRSVPRYLDHVSPSAAAQLSRVARTMPVGAEVISSQGVIGRLAAGHIAHSYWAEGSPETFPVTSRDVVFVLAPIQGIAEGSASRAQSAIRLVEDRLGARPVSTTAGVWAFVWTVPPGTRNITLP